MAVLSNSRLSDAYLRVNNENVECNVLNIGLYAEEFVPKKYDFKRYRTSARRVRNYITRNSTSQYITQMSQDKLSIRSGKLFHIGIELFHYYNMNR